MLMLNFHFLSPLNAKQFTPFLQLLLCQNLTQTLVENEEDKLIKYDLDQPKTVHVRFTLQKECRFGQQILIVGDDPIFGFWDLFDTVPLHWSDGHVWNVELDIPSDTLLKYKFILKGDTNMTQLKESDGIDASQMEKLVNEKPPAMVAESITEENEEPGFDASDELSSLGSIACSKINEENSLSSKDEASLVLDEGVPVLVPGLILMPKEA
ncbi:CBM20 domain-containing protein [Abeliophyllum distichum]|uniref:CBM20 domain-containing protein n=1 Tax=Abeliophyllum distichum TaxID=126358 RepID=A0ABD1Q519_9LAMI